MSLCDGTGESRQTARHKLERGLMPNEQISADVKRAFFNFPLTLLDVSTHHALSISSVSKNGDGHRLVRGCSSGEHSARLFLAATPLSSIRVDATRDFSNI